MAILSATLLRARGSLRLRLALVLGLLSSVASAQQSLEYQVKAAFLLNFTKFIEWPPEAFAAADSPIAICILGEDPFGAAIERLVLGEVVNGRNVAVRTLRSPPPPRSCQVVFFSSSEKEVAKTLRALGPAVLSVGEGDEFLRNGGMIAFVIEERRVRFNIDQAAAERAGLTLSARLLNVAKSVKR